MVNMGAFWRHDYRTRRGACDMASHYTGCTTERLTVSLSSIMEQSFLSRLAGALLRFIAEPILLLLCQPFPAATMGRAVKLDCTKPLAWGSATEPTTRDRNRQRIALLQGEVASVSNGVRLVQCISSFCSRLQLCLISFSCLLGKKNVVAIVFI